MAAPKTVSFTTPGMAPPYTQEMGGLTQEQQLLLEALKNQQEGTDGKLINSGHFFTPDLGGLGNALAARSTNTKLEENRKKQADVQGKYQQALIERMGKFRQDSEGGAVDVAGPPDEGQAQPTRTTAPNQRAFLQYEDDPFPEVAAKARLQREMYNKRAEELGKRASFQSVQAGGEDLSKYAPMQKQEVKDNMVVGVTEGQAPVLLAGQRVPGQLANGTEIDTNTFTGARDAVDRAPKINLPAAGPQLLTEKIKGLEADQKSALAMADTVRSTEQALDAIKQGAQAGYGTDFMQNARTLVSSLTGVQFPESTPTAVLAKTLASNVVNEFGGKLGTGISNADVQFMQQAMGGTNTDPKAIERILAIRAAAAYNAVKRHNENVATIGGEAEKTPAAQRPLSGETVNKLYAVKPPAVNLKFTTPDADASFRAGMGNMGLDQARELNAAEPGKSPAAAAMSPAERKAKLKALGLNPVD